MENDFRIIQINRLGVTRLGVETKFVGTKCVSTEELRQRLLTNPQSKPHCISLITIYYMMKRTNFLKFSFLEVLGPFFDFPIIKQQIFEA